jgi:hypothetical protein
MKLRVPRALAVAVAAVTALVTVAPAAQAATDPLTGWEIVASGLRNPRGIVLLSDDLIAVAEAGANGVFPCNPPSPGTSGKPACYSETGAVTIAGYGTQYRALDGLPSVGPPDGSGASGPHDLAVTPEGLVVVSGYANNPTIRGNLGGSSSLLGTVYRVRWWDGVRQVQGDLAAYEAAYNPDGIPGFEGFWSNPYATAADGADRLVVDAGANTLYRVGANGVSVEYVFPNRMVNGATGPQEMQPVPDAIVRGPDGAFYIGELTGAPYPKGGARVYRYVPGQGAPTVWATGFTNIIDLYFDTQGRLYVLEMTRSGLLSGDPTGRIVRVESNGAQTEIASTGLIFPTSLAVASNGSIYVSNKAILPALGEVVRIPPR